MHIRWNCSAWQYLPSRKRSIYSSKKTTAVPQVGLYIMVYNDAGVSGMLTDCIESCNWILVWRRMNGGSGEGLGRLGYLIAWWWSRDQGKMAVKMGRSSCACCSCGLANSSWAATRIAEGRLSSLAILEKGQQRSSRKFLKSGLPILCHSLWRASINDEWVWAGQETLFSAGHQNVRTLMQELGIQASNNLLIGVVL